MSCVITSCLDKIEQHWFHTNLKGTLDVFSKYRFKATSCPTTTYYIQAETASGSVRYAPDRWHWVDLAQRRHPLDFHIKNVERNWTRFIHSHMQTPNERWMVRYSTGRHWAGKNQCSQSPRQCTEYRCRDSEQGELCGTGVVNPARQRPLSGFPSYRVDYEPNSLLLGLTGPTGDLEAIDFDLNFSNRLKAVLAQIVCFWKTKIQPISRVKFVRTQ